MHFVERFITTLRDRAADRRSEGSPAAALYTRVADELEAEWKQHQLEELPTAVAMVESGYTVQALRKLRREGLWSGKREDLPRRPGKRQRPTGVHSLADERLLRAGGHRT